MSPRLTAERLARIRALYAFDPKHVVNAALEELNAVTRELARAEVLVRQLRMYVDEYTVREEYDSVEDELLSMLTQPPGPR